jgi:O-antigen/teichoic acid export membrane protein
MLGSMSGTAAVGLYAVASRTAAVAASLGNAVTAIASPRLSRLLSEGQDVQHHVSSAGRLAFWPSVAVAVVIILAARPILSLFGTAYFGAYPSLCLLAVAAALSAAAGPATVLLEVSGNHMSAVRVAAGATVVNIVLNGTLIPLFGIMGAAAATTTAIVARIGMLQFACRRRLRISVLAPFSPVSR